MNEYENILNNYYKYYDNEYYKEYYNIYEYNNQQIKENIYYYQENILKEIINNSNFEDDILKYIANYFNQNEDFILYTNDGIYKKCQIFDMLIKKLQYEQFEYFINLLNLHIYNNIYYIILSINNNKNILLQQKQFELITYKYTSYLDNINWFVSILIETTYNNLIKYIIDHNITNINYIDMLKTLINTNNIELILYLIKDKKINLKCLSICLLDFSVKQENFELFKLLIDYDYTYIQSEDKIRLLYYLMKNDKYINYLKILLNNNNIKYNNNELDKIIIEAMKSNINIKLIFLNSNIIKNNINSYTKFLPNYNTKKLFFE
jgi:hypothetical protein